MCLDVRIAVPHNSALSRILSGCRKKGCWSRVGLVQFTHPSVRASPPLRLALAHRRAGNLGIIEKPLGGESRSFFGAKWLYVGLVRSYL